MMTGREAPDPRVFMAIERTYLAWTRTALALMGFGFVVARLGLFLGELAATRVQSAPSSGVAAQGEWRGSVLLGCGLMIIGVVTQCVAVIEHRRRTRHFHAGAPISPMRDSFALIVGMCTIVAGFATVVYLLIQSRAL